MINYLLGLFLLVGLNVNVSLSCQLVTEERPIR